jgi:hypothetical protein
MIVIYLFAARWPSMKALCTDAERHAYGTLTSKSYRARHDGPLCRRLGSTARDIPFDGDGGGQRRGWRTVWRWARRPASSSPRSSRLTDLDDGDLRYTTDFRDMYDAADQRARR